MCLTLGHESRRLGITDNDNVRGTSRETPYPTPPRDGPLSVVSKEEGSLSPKISLWVPSRILPGRVGPRQLPADQKTTVEVFVRVPGLRLWINLILLPLPGTSSVVGGSVTDLNPFTFRPYNHFQRREAGTLSFLN